MRFHTLISVLALLSFACVTALAQTNTTMKGTLVVGILTVESSYAQDTERPSRGVADTLQFWIGSEASWRIKTYAIDHDIHTHSLGDLSKTEGGPVQFARSHITKHYGDVLSSVVVLDFADASDTNAVKRVLAEHKLKGSLEVAKSGFAFLNPDDGDYRSKTKPK